MKFRNKVFSAIALLVLLCFATSAMALTIDRQFDGQWFESDLAAYRGWNVQYIEQGPEKGVLFILGFVYDDEGNPFWVNGATNISPGQFRVSIPLELVEGGTFGPDEGMPMITDPDWGTMEITFHDCNNAEFSWTSPNVADGSNDYVPILALTKGSTTDRCVYQEPFTSCPTFSTPAALERTCILSGTYNQDITLTNNTIFDNTFSIDNNLTFCI